MRRPFSEEQEPEGGVAEVHGSSERIRTKVIAEAIMPPMAKGREPKRSER